MTKRIFNPKQALPFTLLLIASIVVIAFFVSSGVELRRKIRELRKQSVEFENQAEKLQLHSSYLNEIVENCGDLTSPQCVLKVEAEDGSNFLLVVGMGSFITMIDPPSKHGNWYIAALYWTMKMDESIEDELCVTLSKKNLDRFPGELVVWSDYEDFVKRNNKLSLGEFLGKYFVDKGSYWQMKEELVVGENDSNRCNLMVIGYLSRHFHLVVYQADYSGRYFVKSQ